jgi:hypothetical protein
MNELKTKAKVAPKITFDDVFRDERMAIIKEHEAKDPDNVYFWDSAQSVSKSGPGRNKEVVGVEHGNDVLLKMPRTIHEQVRAIEEERSYQLTAKGRGIKSEDEYKTGELRKTPKSIRT